ncbi:MAG: ABC transporter transmembrane domain-containing protein, partial [Propionibacteriaceae bacterium]|nr:ABC transporter transmembrane domain-containing protein [Propionibacteriaceae bacterium]
MSAAGLGGGRMLRRISQQDPALRDYHLPKGLLARVMGYGRPYRGQIAVFLVCVIGDAVLTVAPPLLFKTIIDQGVLGKNVGLIVRYGVAVAMIALIDAGFVIAQRWYSSRIGEGLIYDLRTSVFDHVQRMPVAFFSRTDTGKLVSRLHSDVQGAQQAFTNTLSSVISNLVSLVLVLVAMLSLSWQLTIGALVLLPVFLLPARAIGMRLANLTRDSMSLNADLSSIMTERFSVSGALLVMLFGRPLDEHGRFAGVASSLRDTNVRIDMAGRLFMTALTLVAALATALVYGLGGVLSVDGFMTVGTLTALVGLLTRLYGPLTQLSNVRIDVMSGLVSFERIFDVLDIEPMIVDAPDAVDVPAPAAVEFRCVDFTYPDAATVSLASLEPAAATAESANRQVLFDVSFTVPPGATYALVGTSGAGKTTITHLIARLYDATGGTVLVGGVDVRHLRLQSLRDHVGYVTQDAHMFHDTVRANLAYARPDANDDEMWDALVAAHIDDLVRR